MIEPVNLCAGFRSRQMVHSTDRLWLFSENKDGDFRIHLYDPESNAWNQFSRLNRTVTNGSACNSRLIDAVV